MIHQREHICIVVGDSTIQEANRLSNVRPSIRIWSRKRMLHLKKRKTQKLRRNQSRGGRRHKTPIRESGHAMLGSAQTTNFPSSPTRGISGYTMCWACREFARRKPALCDSLVFCFWRSRFPSPPLAAAGTATAPTIPTTTTTIAGTITSGSINNHVVETHCDPHRDYRKLNQDEQKEYWNWRHNHPDRDHDHDHR